jgi:hypothetical protein
MGCIFTKKKAPEVFDSNTMDSAPSFWKETQLKDMPRWATVEWENEMRKNEYGNKTTLM